jgi:hypothetical protein
MDAIKAISNKLDVLNKSLINIQNNANAHIGAIKALEDIKKELEATNGIPTSTEAGPDTKDVSGNPS